VVAGAYVATVRTQVAIPTTLNTEIATLADLAASTVRRIDASTGRS
jgi:hypothetical protein